MPKAAATKRSHFSLKSSSAPAVANRARPRCPECQTAMDPLFRTGARGTRKVRIPDAFYCTEHDLLAHGRTQARFL
jgi:hypothetical protein